MTGTIRRSRVRRRLAPGDRRAALLASAERLLRRKGLRCRVEDVVRDANASQGTFYVYFDSWETLLLEVRARIFEAFDQQYPLPTAIPADRWWPAMERMCVGFIDFVLELGKLHDAVFHGPLVGENAVPANGGVVARIKELLDRGIKAGAFPPLDTAHLAPLIFAMLHNAVDMIAAGADRERTIAAATHVIRNALASASHVNPAR